MKRRTIEHYEILRRLGAGGSGVVYLANDTLPTGVPAGNGFCLVTNG